MDPERFMKPVSVMKEEDVAIPQILTSPTSMGTDSLMSADGRSSEAFRNVLLANAPQKAKKEEEPFTAGEASNSAGNMQVSGTRIWHGTLYVRGYRNEMMVPCAAIQYPIPNRPAVESATGWSSQIYCKVSTLKECSSVFQYMNEPNSQWYVRLAPIDANGNESMDLKLARVAKVMIQRQLAFEVPCNDTRNDMGTLYIWGMEIPPHGHSLLGVFRPGLSSVQNVAPERPIKDRSETTTESRHRSHAEENLCQIKEELRIVSESTVQNGNESWKGTLHVRGHRRDMVIPCFAVRYRLSLKLPVRDYSGWPSQIYCNSSVLKQHKHVFQFMKEPNTQWYVRFAPVDTDNTESVGLGLVKLAKVMIHRQLAFEIPCHETENAFGTLYIWGMEMPLHGPSLLGVFRPDEMKLDTADF